MKRSMRVLIIRNAYQQDAGGAEQYALNLAIALKNEGHIPFLTTKVKEIIKKGEEHNIRTVPAMWHESQGWDRSYYVRYPLTVLWYMWIIILKRIDVVHPQSRDDFVFATRAARILGKKVVWTDHADLKHILDNTNHYNPRMRGWIINAAKKVTAIICVSNSELTAIKAVAPELQKLIVIHNGVFIPKETQPEKKTNTIVIGTNARLVPDKGIAELIEALALMSDSSIDLWLLGGVSGNREKYEMLAKKLGVEKQIKIIGYVNKPNDYVAAMDIFVHASYHEGLSLAIIEAAMLKRPIIATRVGGTPEIINSDCGMLIKPKNSELIANAVKSLLADEPLRNSLASAAQQKALRDFDFKRIVEKKIIPLYEEVRN